MKGQLPYNQFPQSVVADGRSNKHYESTVQSGRPNRRGVRRRRVLSVVGLLPSATANYDESEGKLTLSPL